MVPTADDVNRLGNLVAGLAGAAIGSITCYFFGFFLGLGAAALLVFLIDFVGSILFE